MAKKKSDDSVTGLLFVVSLVLSVLLGAFGSINNSNVATLLVLLGILLGFLMTKSKKAKDFGMAGLFVVLVAALVEGRMMVPVMNGVFKGLMLTFAPAVAAVALSDMMNASRD